MDEQQNDERPEDTAPEAGGEETQAGAAPPPPGPGRTEAPPLPPELQAAGASKDDRTSAMLCHLLALAGLIFPFGNILGPLIMWLVKRESSPFVDFHGRQSLWFQVWAAIAATVLGIISIPLMSICIGIVTILLAMAIGVGAVIYAIIGAVQVSGGKDFEYLWVGPWVWQSMM